MTMRSALISAIGTSAALSYVAFVDAIGVTADMAWRLDSVENDPKADLAVALNLHRHNRRMHL